MGSRKVTTIALDDLTSSDIESQSKPKWLVLGLLVALIGLLLQSGVVAAFGLPFFLAWFFTRRKTMVLRSASEKIECAAPFGKWAELQEFIHKIQTAKARKALGPSNQQEVRPTLSEVGAKAMPVVQTPRPTEIASTPADGQAVAPIRATFWTAPPSFTFDSGAVSAAAAAAAPRHSAPLSASALPAQIESKSPHQLQASRRLKLVTSREKSSEEIASDEAEKTSGAVISAQEGDPRVPDANPPTSVKSAEASDISVPTARSTVPTSDIPTTNVTVPVSTPKKYSAATLAVCIGISVTVALTAAVLFISRSERSSQSGAVAGSVSVNDEKAIKNAINVWVRSFRDKDGLTHAACYAPVVEKYFKRYDVSNEKLLRDKENAFAAMELVRTYDISDIQVAAEPGGRIAATFHKDWDTRRETAKISPVARLRSLHSLPIRELGRSSGKKSSKFSG